MQNIYSSRNIAGQSYSIRWMRYLCAMHCFIGENLSWKLQAESWKLTSHLGVGSCKLEANFTLVINHAYQTMCMNGLYYSFIWPFLYVYSFILTIICFFIDLSCQMWWLIIYFYFFVQIIQFFKFFYQPIVVLHMQRIVQYIVSLMISSTILS